MKFTSLTHRLLVWFVLVALLPLALLGYMALRYNGQLLHAQALHNLGQLADKKAQQIKAHLAERTSDVRMVARTKTTEEALLQLSHSYRSAHPDSPQYQQVDARYRAYFNRYIDDDPIFYDVFLINPQGDIVYSSRHESDFATNLLAGPYRASQLAQVFRESRMTLESSLSDFAYYLPSNAQAAFVAAPIIRQGVLRGVLVFQLNIAQIYQVAADPVGLGRTGETVLAKWIDPQHAMFVAPLKYVPDAMQHTLELEMITAPMLHALSGNRGSGVDTDYRGKRVVAVWRYLPELRWGMVVKIDADEAFAPIVQQRKILVQLFSLLALLAGVAAYYFGRRLVLPLKAFALTADEVAQGDLSKRVAESRADEIGVLARAFNHMTENLQSLYRTLEHRIEERTRELSSMNEQLQQEASERKQTAQKLLESEESTRLVLEHALDAVIIIDAAGKVIEWNSEAARIFAYRRDEAIGKVLADLIIPAMLREAHSKGMQRLLATNESRIIGKRIEISAIRRDGSEFPVELSIAQIHRGERVLFSAFLRDITERKRAEEALRIAAAAFDTHEGILITDAQANIIRVNHAFQQITGYSAQEVLGKNPRLLSSGRHDQAFYAEMWRQLLDTGSWDGEILDRRKSGEIYPKWLTITAVKNEHAETTEYVGIFSDITERKEAEEEIRNLAFYDALTGLPNRRLLLDRFHLALSVSARSHHYGAVLFLDMDRFKTINDTLGHAHGDLLLVEVAQRIRACVREVDTVARLGGDEFVMLIADVGAEAQDATQNAALIAEKIRMALNVPYQLNGRDYHSSPSIGVCLYCGTEETVDDLLIHADMAMYQAKDSGRNTVRFFDPQMQQAVENRAVLETDLRSAVPHRQLRLHYQMQVDNENRALGAEALVRWMHPQRGMVFPDQFIPISEESSLILDIGSWVLETACQQLALWGKDEKTRDLTLAVNVSAQQFRLHDFVEQVAAMLRVHCITPSRLKFELTESMVLSDVADVVKKMHALRALGVKLSMDDFGTGYSSLSYLKQLPLDQLKIDQSFVRDIAIDPNDAVMVQTIIGMARNFRLNVIAEGVETVAQLAFLKQHGCMAYQGYLFSKPLPIEEFEALLDTL